MRLNGRLFLLAALLLVIVVHPAYGQGKLKYVFIISVPEKGQRNAKVIFDEPLVSLSASQIELKTKAAGAATFKPTPLTITNVSQQGGNPAVWFIEYADDPSRANDTDVQATFTNLVFKTSGTVNSIVGTGPIYTTKTISKLDDAATKRLKDAATKAKTNEEKQIFAAFSAAAPATGKAEGTGEVNLNQWVSPDFFVSLNTKKSSAEQADPKQFNLGLTYRKVFLVVGKAADRVDDAVRNFVADPSPENQDAMREAVNNLRGKTLLGVLLDVNGRIEGEALNFNVTNAVLDVPVQLSSRTKNIGNGDSYFNFRIIGGVELGRNLRSENALIQKYYIGRFKYGGEASFIYEPADQETAFPKRVELTLQAVDRYLWRDETAFDQTTGKASGISRGHKPWYQMDLKVFLGTSSQGRFGFRINRIRGMLPPTFSDTRAYTFGAVFESADDKSQQQQQ